MTFTIRHPTGNVSLPIIDDSLKNSKYHLIPPRCEVIRHFRLIGDYKSDQVVCKKELFPGVFIASSIVNPNNCYLRILNTNTRSVEVKKILKLNTEPLTQFNIVASDQSNTKRKDTLINIISKNIPKHAPESLKKLCTDYADIFALPGDKHSVNNFYTQSLNLSDTTPVYTKNYRQPHAQKQEISNQVKNMLQQNIIEPSCSNYNSPIILVPKKSINGQKKYRLCVDFRSLNRRLIPDKFPLPRIDEVLDSLGRARYFSTLDLHSGFWQVPLDEKSKPMTSFSTAEGSFQFKVLPFGLNVAPNSFARMMTIAFSGLDPAIAFIYLDDVIVIGTSPEHHMKNLEKVFKVCRDKNLKLNPEKCQFMKTEVTFLGHKCTDKGILPDNSKFDTISEYPVPHDKDSAKRFVLFCNYYRQFIENFSTIAAPINNLDKKKVIFNWSPECQSAFETLKTKLKSPPILQYPDFSKPFIITVDASKSGVGAVLSQQSTDGIDLPVSYASRSFIKGEHNYPPIQQELMAIHFGINHFRPYVYGTKFTVRSDHKPLTYLFSLKDPTSKLARIRLELTDYDFHVEYIKGTDNVAADALSRIHISHFVKLHLENVKVLAMTTRSMSNTVAPIATSNLTTSEHVINALNNYEYRNTPAIKFTVINSGADKYEIACVLKTRHLSSTRTLLLNIKDNLNRDVVLESILTQLNSLTDRRDITTVKLCCSDPLLSIIPIATFKEKANVHLTSLTIVIMQPIKNIELADERLRLMQHYHNHPLEGGHAGFKRTYCKLKSLFYWQNMSRDLAAFIKSCNQCQVNKPKRKIKEEMVLTSTPSGPFQSVIIDTIGPFPSTVNQSKYALTIICDFSKYLIIVPVPNKEAKTIAKAFLYNCFLVFGPVKRIRSDLGTEYVNSVMKDLTDLLQIHHDKSTAYHHETIGTVERSHKTLNEYLRTYIADNHKAWHTYVKYFAYCFNTTPNTAVDMYTPFELVFGRASPPITIDSHRQNSDSEDYHDFVSQQRSILERAHRKVEEFIKLNKLEYKAYYDADSRPIVLKPGDRVLLVNEVRSKLDPLYKPNYVVDHLEGSNVVIHNIDRNQLITVHKNRIRKA